jgi:hypothetical protein
MVIAHVGAVVLFDALFVTGAIHPFAVLVFIAAFDLIVNGRRGVDRILLASVAVLGVIPVFGWVRLPDFLEPLSIVTGIWLVWGFTELRDEWRRAPVDALAALPPVVGAVVTYQWWCGISKGSPTQVLERLLPIWDHSAHFNFFLMNLSKGTYISRAAGGSGPLAWQGSEYPTGVHYVWSRFAASSRELIVQHTDRAIPVYANSVVVTMAVTVLLVGLAIGRLATTTHRRLAFSAVGTGLIVGVVTLGPVSQTVYAGFANTPVVLVGVVVVVSFTIRPWENPVLQLFAVGAGSLVLLYNWYPTFLLILPVLLLQAIRLIRTGNRIPLLAVGIPCAIAGVLPVLQTLSLGVTHLNTQGGVQPLPPGVLVAVVLLTFSLGAHALSEDDGWTIFLLCIPTPVFLLALALRLRMSTGGYPYYFHKASIFAIPIALIVVVAVIATRADKRAASGELRMNQKVAFVAASLFAGIGISQVFGYWGLDYPTFSAGNTAIGVLSRNDIMKGGNQYLPTVQIIIRESEAVRDLPIETRSCLTMVIPARIGILSGIPDNPWKDTLSNVWFHALSDSYTIEAQVQAFMTANVAPTLGNEADLVNAISKTFDPPSVCIFSTPYVTSQLNERRDDWTTRDLASS